MLKFGPQPEGGAIMKLRGKKNIYVISKMIRHLFKYGQDI